MKSQFEYKGYVGSAEVDIEGEVLVGSLLFIRDTITYSATTPSGLETAFREAVDDYLQTCAEEGDTPDQPLKGSFNVRVGPELHRKVAIAARQANKGLNEYVCASLEVSVSEKQQREHTYLGPVTWASVGPTFNPLQGVLVEALPAQRAMIVTTSTGETPYWTMSGTPKH